MFSAGLRENYILDRFFKIQNSAESWPHGPRKKYVKTLVVIWIHVRVKVTVTVRWDTAIYSAWEDMIVLRGVCLIITVLTQAVLAEVCIYCVPF